MSTRPNQPWDSDPSQPEGEYDDSPDVGPQEEHVDDHFGDQGSSSSIGYDYAYPRRRRILPTLIAVVLLLSAVACGVYFWMARQDVQADVEMMDNQGVEFCEAFLEHVRSDRLGDAYRLTSPAYQRRQAQPQFEAYVRKGKDALTEPFKNYKFKVPPLSIAAFGKKVTGEYRATRKLAGGVQDEIAIKIVRDAGVLKVEEFSITR